MSISLLMNKRTYRGPGVYIGRPSKWGNPFTVGPDGTRDEVIQKYADWLADQPQLLDDLEELRGRRLICWCTPARCHGEVLLRLLYGD